MKPRGLTLGSHLAIDGGNGLVIDKGIGAPASCTAVPPTQKKDHLPVTLPLLHVDEEQKKAKESSR